MIWNKVEISTWQHMLTVVHMLHVGTHWTNQQLWSELSERRWYHRSYEHHWRNPSTKIIIVLRTRPIACLYSVLYNNVYCTMCIVVAKWINWHNRRRHLSTLWLWVPLLILILQNLFKHYTVRASQRMLAEWQKLHHTAADYFAFVRANLMDFTSHECCLRSCLSMF